MSFKLVVDASYLDGVPVLTREGIDRLLLETLLALRQSLVPVIQTDPSAFCRRSRSSIQVFVFGSCAREEAVWIGNHCRIFGTIGAGIGAIALTCRQPSLRVSNLKDGLGVVNSRREEIAKLPSGRRRGSLGRLSKILVWAAVRTVPASSRLAD